MNILTILYLADVSDSLSTTITGFLILSTIIFCVYLFICFMEYITAGKHDEDKENIKTPLKIFKKYYWIYFLIVLINCLIPSGKTLYLMLGANYLTNSQLPQKVEMVIEKKLDSYLKDKK